MVICWVVIWKFVGFALAEHVKKIMVFRGDLIMDSFEFLRIEGF